MRLEWILIFSLMSPGIHAAVPTNCEPAILQSGPTPLDYAQATELLQFITLTSGFAAEALAESESDLAFATTLFLATGYSLPGPKMGWLREARIMNIHWSVFRSFAKNQKAMHAHLRSVWRETERVAYVHRILRNLERFRQWIDRADGVGGDDWFYVALFDKKGGTVYYRPSTIGILQGAHRAQTRRVLSHLTSPAVVELVKQFLIENFHMVVANHFELAGKVTYEKGPEPNDYSDAQLHARPIGLKIDRQIQFNRQTAGLAPSELDSPRPIERIPAPKAEPLPERSKSSDEIAQFLLHPNRHANGGEKNLKLLFLDIEFEIRTVLSFVTSIQNHVSRVVQRGPEWATLATSYDPRAEWLESLEHHLDVHRRLGLERSKVLDQARLDLISINQWIERELRAVEKANADVRQRQNVEPLEARDLLTINHLLPQLGELALSAKKAIDLRITHETQLRVAMVNVELILSKTLQARILSPTKISEASELESALKLLADNYGN